MLGGVQIDMRAKLDREFEEFVRARSASFLRTAALLVGDVDQAQDLLQQALWRTHRHWGRAIDNPDAYLRKVLVNLVHDARRHARRRVVERPLDDVAQAVVGDDTALLADRDALLAALRLIPPRQRVTLVLRFWDDLAVDETAFVLGCSSGTVKSTTSKGLANLRQILDGQAKSELEPGSVK